MHSLLYLRRLTALASNGRSALGSSRVSAFSFGTAWLPPSSLRSYGRAGSLGAFGVNVWPRQTTPTPTPPGREGRKNGAALPRASARRLAFALGYYRIVLSGLQFALARRIMSYGISSTPP